MRNKTIKIGISLALFAMVLTACNKGNSNNEANIFHGVLPILSENDLEKEAKSQGYIATNLSGQYTVNQLNMEYNNVGGVVCRENDFILVDTGSDLLHVIDYNGDVIRQVGVTGNGELEFLSPMDIAISKDKIYILDSKNYRIQVLDSDFNYLESIKYYDLIEDYQQSVRLISIAVDAEENIYISSLDGEYSKIICYISSEKIFKEFGENFHGFLDSYDGEVYAINLGSKLESTATSHSEVRTGKNYLYKLDGEGLELMHELYFGLTPSGFVKTQDGVYLVSGSYHRIDFFDDKGKYQNSIALIDDIGFYSYLAKDKASNFYISMPFENKFLQIDKQ